MSKKLIPNPAGYSPTQDKMSILKRKKIELSPRLKLGVGRSNSNRILKFSAVMFLILAALLAANALRLVFFHSGSAITSNGSPQVLGATDVKTPGDSQNQQPQVISYKVASGDTLFSISQQFGISWATLAALNNLKSPFTLKLDQILTIPKP